MAVEPGGGGGGIMNVTAMAGPWQQGLVAPLGTAGRVKIKCTTNCLSQGAKPAQHGMSRKPSHATSHKAGGSDVTRLHPSSAPPNALPRFRKAPGHLDTHTHTRARALMQPVRLGAQRQQHVVHLVAGNQALQRGTWAQAEQCAQHVCHTPAALEASYSYL